MPSHRSHTNRAVKILMDAVPRSNLCAALAEQVGEQLRYDLQALRAEADALRAAPEQDTHTTLARIEGTIEALEAETRRWQGLATAFTTAPTTRETNPQNLAYVRIGRPDT